MSTSQYFYLVCKKFLTRTEWYLLKQLKDWTESMQDALPRCGFCGFYTIWKEFSLQFLEVSERNDGKNSFWILHNGGIRSEKVTSILPHFTCQWSCHSAGWCQSCCSLLEAILPWSKLLQKFFKDLLHWWDSSSRLEKASKCNMLRQNSLTDGEGQYSRSVLMIRFMPGMWRLHGISVWSGSPVVAKQKAPIFPT